MTTNNRGGHGSCVAVVGVLKSGNAAAGATAYGK